jgi:hypothetical protein
VSQVADEYAIVRDLPADFQIAPAATTTAAATATAFVAPRKSLHRGVSLLPRHSHQTACSNPAAQPAMERCVHRTHPRWAPSLSEVRRTCAFTLEN